MIYILYILFIRWSGTISGRSSITVGLLPAVEVSAAGLGANSPLLAPPVGCRGCTHHYRARESVLHMLAEQHGWLTKHCLVVPPSAP